MSGAGSGASKVRLVPALMRGLDVLELFLEGEETLSAAQIVKKLGLPRTTAHELLVTLVSRNYLAVRHEDPRRYALGPLVLHLGQKYQETVELRREALPIAHRLMVETGETIQVATLDRAQVYYIVKEDSPKAVRLVSALGARLPAHATAVGKALLAGLPPAEARTRLKAAAPLEPITEHTVTDIARLLSQLDDYRAQGWAQEFEESNPDGGCVAAPIFDHEGVVIASMSVAAPTSRYTPENRDRWLDLLLSAARELSMRMGHQPD